VHYSTNTPKGTQRTYRIQTGRYTNRIATPAARRWPLRVNRQAEADKKGQAKGGEGIWVGDISLRPAMCAFRDSRHPGTSCTRSVPKPRPTSQDYIWIGSVNFSWARTTSSAALPCTASAMTHEQLASLLQSSHSARSKSGVCGGLLNCRTARRTPRPRFLLIRLPALPHRVSSSCNPKSDVLYEEYYPSSRYMHLPGVHYMCYNRHRTPFSGISRGFQCIGKVFCLRLEHVAFLHRHYGLLRSSETW
jgi:hypothetical protein